MDSVPEVVVVSDSGSKDNNCSIYNLKNGSIITSFKDGNSAKKCLSFIGQDYVISALNNQSALKVWVLNKRLPDMCSMVIPGLATSLAVSNCGIYCVVGIDKLFNVWEISSGCLLSSVQHHSKPVSCLRFSSDGSHLISGSKDGMVLVWLLSELVSASDSSDNVKPRYVWLDHASEVTDIHVGSLGIFARVATVSKDMTCRIYDLECGKLLTTVQVNFAITAVCVDESDYFLMLGSPEGTIYRINMFAVNKPEVEYDSSDKNFTYSGHSKEITCLSVSTTGKYLLSGSEDCDCRIWDIMRFACINVLSFKGPVTNAFITLLPPGLKNESEYVPRLRVHPFKRQYENDDSEYLSAKIQTRNLSLMHLEAPDEYFDQRVLNYSEESLNDLNRNRLTEEMMSVINHQIYSYALCESYNQLSDDSQEDSD